MLWLTGRVNADDARYGACSVDHVTSTQFVTDAPELIVGNFVNPLPISYRMSRNRFKC